MFLAIAAIWKQARVAKEKVERSPRSLRKGGLQGRRVGPSGESGLAGPAPRGPGAAGREGGSLVLRLRRPSANTLASSSSPLPAVCR